jgi:hypothetical protein
MLVDITGKETLVSKVFVAIAVAADLVEQDRVSFCGLVRFAGLPHE